MKIDWSKVRSPGEVIDSIEKHINIRLHNIKMGKEIEEERIRKEHERFLKETGYCKLR